MSDIDMNGGTEQLSARQKEILRLVAAHFERKEIARLLNISPHTVKAHIDAARKRLGVATDRQAARLLAEKEGAMILASPVVAAPDVAGNPHGLAERLKRLNMLQVLGAIVLLAIGLALAFLLLMAGGITTMQAIQSLTGQTR
ncbi:bacterial regulatory protein, luxR family protein [Asticcacaulis biprosthecium C19]|uniref:Bacterial regulatory protein, luxR family protein n=1 Tax=Asticcacaulis biprosthecium C19 TaxID=715226 RepID=F4QIA2_9CAUL|nr:helix-turn-helix transcriptional regulator [Asticcacaulis biprosthecium]EGF91740.1 bacterial regulatory protein, luxR family protein [Asticcacaulis biprosthecium C19]